MAENLDHQLAMTADLVEHMRAIGDKVDVPRQVDHLAFFPKRAADAVVADLTAAGFSVGEAQRRLFKVGVEFHRTDACDQESAAAFTRDVVGIVNRHGGSYDGWSSMVQR
ncbi:ribonuclease E inhibitor RraB [Cellulomonas fimi]|uniref:ribonuclease E inhibitor RraB n=1 Tax=Cellulomonas fimi TaxID=1708 RepID=UPI0023584734|nr:ribonuclease E inhibitor RraB [Cellulomonas fimi]